MNLGLFEDRGYRQLLPLTWLRPAFELRCGADRLIDKAERHIGQRVARLWVRPELRDALAERLRLADAALDEPWCLLNARALLTADLDPPPVGTAWQRNGALAALGIRAAELEDLPAGLFLEETDLLARVQALGLRVEHAPESIRLIEYPWHLVLANRDELVRQCGSGGRQEGFVHPGAHLLNPGAIYIGPGAAIKPGVVLDAADGPIHIEAGVQIQPNAVLEGPCYVGVRSVIRPTAVIRAGTTIGPVCKVGGEVEASIFQGYSNKQHDGFLGHSFIGEWVNLGADTVTSDLKNTYGMIRAYINGVGVDTGQNFLGSIIGDHAKTGIGTILPTGGIIGIASNVFTPTAVPKFVPSFAWLTEAGPTRYRLEKAIQIARVVTARRDVHLSDAEIRLIEYAASAAQRIEAAGWAE